MKNTFKSKTSLFLLFTSLTLSLLLSLALFFYITRDKPIVVMDMTTMSQGEILLWANEHELNIETIEVYDDLSAAGEIISQDAATDSTVLAGQSITITVSKGPNPNVLVQIEDFNGKDIAAIQAFIDTSKLMNADILFEKSSETKAAFLISQSITNEEIKRSEKITFVVSTGTRNSLDKISVPDFSALSKSEITQWGSNNNIKMNFVNEFNAKERGEVFEQSSSANSYVYDGSSITVKVSRGPGVTLDNLVGKTKAEIDSFASNKNLKVSYTYVYSSTRAKDTAISMTPNASTHVEEQTTITVALSLGRISVVNHTGKTLSSFESWVKMANTEGATLRTASSIIFSDSVPAGSIVSQTPATGEINPGTTITLQISKGSGVIVKAFASKTDIQQGLRTTLTERYSTEARDTIIAQSIAVGTRVDLNTPMTLTVSLGRVPITSMIGATPGSFQTWINSLNANGANLTIRSSEAYTANQSEKGTITSQTPSSDAVNPGATITIVVSKGTLIRVPTLIGTATTSFEGFVVNRSEQYSSTVPKGTVISQSIAAGTEAEHGSTLSIVVSSGVDPATEPTYLPPLAPMVANTATSFNDTVSRLSAYLSGLGFTNYRFVSGDFGIGPGQVNSQTPSVGSYNKNTEITIHVQR